MRPDERNRMKQENNYHIFDPEKSLEENFSSESTPLLLMEQLRMLDYPISRGVSYERTVDEFLLQLETNDSLRPLRNCPEAVILLNEEGAMIRHEGRWELVFTPEKPEGQPSGEKLNLPALLKKLLAEEKKKIVCRVRIPERSLKVMVSGNAPFSILDEYCKSQPGRYLAVAEKIVYEGMEILSQNVPVCRYGKLISADKEEIENYHTIKALLDDYIYQYDHLDRGENLQPLSIAVFGAPGCGKSFGVKQIAESSGRFSIAGMNLSQYHAPGEFFEALREGLQSKSNQIPLIFIDEFDAELNGVPRGWLRYFLALMQDGEFTLNGKKCEVSGAVLVFAGATASSFNRFLPGTAEEQDAFRLVKGTDFVSRLKGILNVKGPNPSSDTDRCAIIRRGMLLREQIFRRFPGIRGEDGRTVRISRCLVSAMLRVSEYRHGTRSMELILGMSCLSGVNRFTPSCLPMEEQMNLHLDADDFRRKLQFEQIMGGVVERYAEIAHEHFREQRESEIRLSGRTEEEIRKELDNPELVPWDELDEFYREGYRSQIRYMGERLESYQISIGLRPVLQNTADAVSELYGPTLELLAETEHERWMRDKKAEGWRNGKPDRELKLTPDLVPYSELDEETREMIRKSLRTLPMNLKEIGYELYTKSF